MNKERISKMQEIANEINEFQQQITQKIKAVLTEEEQALEGMEKMPENLLTAGSANAVMKQESNFYVHGMKDIIKNIDNSLSDAYHLLMGLYL